MKSTIKNILFSSPAPIKKAALKAAEALLYFKSLNAIKSEMVGKKSRSKNQHDKPRILFYHVSGLSFAGTEKFLQVIAKHIDQTKYDVIYMYSPKPRASSGNIPLDGRKPYLEGQGIEFIEFDYDAIEQKNPYIVRGMKPSVFDVMAEKDIDLFVTAGSGHAEYPFNAIRNIPIVLINIFGSPSVQKNISMHISISKEVDGKISDVVPAEKRDVTYIQSERPDPSFKELGRELRRKFGIKDTDTVFGRIGRADDGIFDPIGIHAFAEVVKEHPDAHYIIMSPPPIVKEIVKKLNILNVYYCTPSAVEADVWAFHYSLDALAHFRLDGESFGLNIAESMIAGNPIITHRSHIWNAHLEYLDPSFSFIADKDDVHAYASHMKKIIAAKKDGSINRMKEAAEETGSKMFIIDHSIRKIEAMIDNALTKK